MTWTNKKKFNSHTLYLNNPLSNVEIAFLNQTRNWICSAMSTSLMPLTQGKTNHLKVTYEYSPENNNHILLAQTTAPIDK